MEPEPVEQVIGDAVLQQYGRFRIKDYAMYRNGKQLPSDFYWTQLVDTDEKVIDIGTVRKKDVTYQLFVQHIVQWLQQHYEHLDNMRQLVKQYIDAGETQQSRYYAQYVEDGQAECEKVAYALDAIAPGRLAFEAVNVEAQKLLHTHTYEQRILFWLERYLLGKSPIGNINRHMHPERVSIEWGQEEKLIVILFRDDREPLCLFGFCRSLYEKSEEVDKLDTIDPSVYAVDPAVGWVDMVVNGYLAEETQAGDAKLPENCANVEIAWLPGPIPIRK